MVQEIQKYWILVRQNIESGEEESVFFAESDSQLMKRPLLMVKKRDGSFEPFDRQKLITGIFNAIKKRPVSVEQVAAIAEGIEQQCANAMRSTVTSVDIGNWVMEHLKRIDAVAYIRFASVYEDFTDVASFVAAISALDEETAAAKTAESKEQGE